MMRILILALFISLSVSAEERFPVPTEEEVSEASKKVYEYGKEEIFSLSYLEFATFILGRYYYGPYDPFTEYNCNPSTIDPARPALLLIHASESNQGEWLPLLSSFKERQDFNIFSFNYRDETGLEELIQKIERIRALYFESGSDNVTLNLIGHSLGGIIAAEYSFDDSLLVPGTTIDKVIAIASRLRNIDRPVELPLYPYCYPVLQRVDLLSAKLEKYQGSTKLYTIAAEKDWLLPMECALIGEKQAIIPSCGHVLVTHAKETHDMVAEWLSEI